VSWMWMIQSIGIVPTWRQNWKMKTFDEDGVKRRKETER
jgi:hypothetical protein